MNLYGFQSLTLLDYPGHLAATIFTGGCNYRCPFCHNGDLVAPEEPVSREKIFDTLKRRRTLLDGVCITGGEPTIHPELPDLIDEIRDLGYPVKLDTNGTHPEVLRQLLKSGKVDYIAMDIKNSPERYASSAGTADPHPEAVRESVTLLMTSDIPFEFRTTLVPELHRAEDMTAIGEWIAGAPRYFLQAYRESAFVISPVFSEPRRDWMEMMRRAVLPYVPAAEIRGID